MIYLAAPLFSNMEKQYINFIIQEVCHKLKLDPINDIYSPIRDNKYNDPKSQIYDKNIENLNNCDIMIAILDGKDVDSGTAFEIGYFESQNKLVMGLLTDKRSYEDGNLNLKLNIMIFGSLSYGDLVFDNIDDLISELNYYLVGD